MLDVLFAESHPEPCLTDGGVVLHQTLQLLMVKQVALAWTNVGVGERFVNLQWLCLYPFAVFVVQAFLGYLAYVDFRVEVGCECLVMVSCIAVHDVEIVHLVEMVLGCICGINAAHAWVKAAAEDGAKAGLLETLLICPLP